jgi:uncharacterized protein (TIRG00374 family)
MNRLRFVYVALAAVIVGFIVWTIGPTEIRRALAEANPRLFAAALALNVPMLTLLPIRSHFVLQRLGARVPARVLIPVSILGSIAGSLTPASSGELLRTAVLRTHASLPVEDGLALVAYERALSLWMMIVATAAGAALVTLDRPLALAISAALLPTLAAPLLAPLVLDRLPNSDRDERAGLRAALIRGLLRMLSQTRVLLGDAKLLAVWSALTATMFAIATAQLWLLSRCLSNSIHPGEAWVAFGASSLASIASLLPFGIGSLDGSLAALLHEFGARPEQGIATALLLRLAITLPLVLIALACSLYLHRIAASATEAAQEVVDVAAPIDQ